MMAALSNIFSPAAIIFPYLLLVLAINWPIRARRTADSGTCAISFIFALVSTCFLPWTGVPIAYCLGLPPGISCLWYPAMVLAIFCAGPLRMPSTPKIAWLFCVALIVSSLAWFTYRNGVPGFAISMETLGMLLKLEGLRNGRLCAAMILFALSLVLSFCEIPRIADCRLTSFSYAAGLCLVFLPVNTSGLFSLAPAASIIIDFLISLAMTTLIQNVLFTRIEGFLSRSRAHRTRLLTPVLFALAGAYFLYTSIG